MAKSAKIKKHTGRKHSGLGPSAAARWIACPPSVKLSEGVKEDRDLTAAEEGTLAHEFAELELLRALDRAEQDVYETAIAKLRTHELYGGKKMENYVAEYVNFVLEAYAEEKARSGAYLAVEQRVRYDAHVPGGFGTTDAGIIGRSTIHVVDLKYGMGNPVYAENNPQGMLYGLGTYLFWADLTRIEILKITIHQPRLHNVTTWEISIDDLLTWVKEIVAPAAKLAVKGEGTLNPGPHCKWCRVRLKCRARVDYLNENTRKAFEKVDPRLLSDAELIAFYERLPMIKKYMSQAAEHLLSKALRGVEVPGYRLVHKRSNRKWSDPEAVESRLREMDLDPEDFLNVKLKGLGDVADLMTEDQFQGFSDLIIKPEGGPALVPDSAPGKTYSPHDRNAFSVIAD